MQGKLVRSLTLAGLVAAGLVASRGVMAQQADGLGGGRGQFAGMQRVNGEVTAVSTTGLTVKTEDGSTVQVTTTDNTRIMKTSTVPGAGGAGAGGGMGRGGTPAKMADLKVGDGVVAMGNLDAPNKTLHALMLMATDASVLKALKDNLGKTYITGKVTAIDVDNAKMTVERPDKVSQVIGFDETTSFKRGRPGGMGGRAGGAPGGAGAAAPEGESITLADIKVGDNVTGQGALKSGTFVPAQLMISTPGTGGPRRGGQVPAGAAPASATPSPAAAGPGTK